MHLWNEGYGVALSQPPDPTVGLLRMPVPPTSWKSQPSTRMPTPIQLQGEPAPASPITNHEDAFNVVCDLVTEANSCSLFRRHLHRHFSPEHKGALEAYLFITSTFPIRFTLSDSQKPHKMKLIAFSYKKYFHSAFFLFFFSKVPLSLTTWIHDNSILHPNNTNAGRFKWSFYCFPHCSSA